MYHVWVALNMKVEKMLNLCWVEERVELFALLVLCWQIAQFSLHIRIISFATESVVILKQEHLQVNVLSNENCFEEIGFKVATSSLFGLKEWKC